jgi:hypothetical protein
LPTDSQKASATAPNQRRRVIDFVTVATFLGLLGLPLVALWLGNGAEISGSEKRLLARPPQLEAQWASWASFPRRSEAYFGDHLGFRETMIRNFARIHIAIFGLSPSDKLIVGREGWFFYGDPDAVANYRGTDPLGPGELARWQRTLEERRDWLADQGIAYLVILVPDKHEVYGEYMPPSLPRATELNPLDQLADYLGKKSRVEVLDLRLPLQAAKVERRIYHRTDTHWNEAGAHAAYRAILQRLGALLPTKLNPKPAPVERGRHESPGLGLAGLVGLENVLGEEILSARLSRPRARIAREHRARYDQRTRDLEPVAHGIPDPQLPRAVVFRDSFGNALIPFLSEHFQRVLYVWDRDVDPQVVKTEKPDIVIQQIVGRFLRRRPRGIAELEAAEQN